jgi:hypothetical protein
MVHTRGDLLFFDDPPTRAENVIAKVTTLERFGRKTPIRPAGLRLFARAEGSLGFLAAAAHTYARVRYRLVQPITRETRANA